MRFSVAASAFFAAYAAGMSILTGIVGTHADCCPAALSITSPKKGEDVDLTQDVKIEWSAVKYVHLRVKWNREYEIDHIHSTDPSTFDIYLVNMNVYPNVNQLVASNVKASDGSYTFKGTTGITTGYVMTLYL